MNASRLVGVSSAIGCLLGLALVIAGCSASEDESAADAPPPADTSAPTVDEAMAALENAAPGLADVLSGLGDTASGFEEAWSGADTAAGVNPDGPAPGNPTCCSCAFTAGNTYSDPRLPCLFDFPEPWAASAGGDGMMISGVAGPPPQACANTVCPQGSPAMSVTYGKTPDANADTMLQIWPTAMPVVGRGRCGEGAVQFFSPPGAQPTGHLGGVKFYVEVGGQKYGGAAQFICGEPGGWMRLRDMFIDSFRDNPESTFPDG